jgi:hypothetical protein
MRTARVKAFERSGLDFDPAAEVDAELSFVVILAVRVRRPDDDV